MADLVTKFEGFEGGSPGEIITVNNTSLDWVVAADSEFVADGFIGQGAGAAVTVGPSSSFGFTGWGFGSIAFKPEFVDVSGSDLSNTYGGGFGGGWAALIDFGGGSLFAQPLLGPYMVASPDGTDLFDQGWLGQGLYHTTAVAGSLIAHPIAGPEVFGQWMTFECSTVDGATFTDTAYRTASGSVIATFPDETIDGALVEPAWFGQPSRGGTGTESGYEARSWLTLTVDDLRLGNFAPSALTAVRQYPRDDARGWGGSPRIHPPSKNRRIVGRYQ